MTDPTLEDDAELRKNLEDVADIIATRLELAVVQRVPQALLDDMFDGLRHTFPLSIGKNYTVLHFVRRANVLEFTFEHNGQPTSTFRFEGHA